MECNLNDDDKPFTALTTIFLLTLLGIFILMINSGAPIER